MTPRPGDRKAAPSAKKRAANKKQATPASIFDARLPSFSFPEVDFDLHHPAVGREDIFLAFKRLHDQPEVFWTPRNGGHWVVTRGAEIREILGDPQSFSSRTAFIDGGNRPRFAPLEIDPPEHAGYRKMLAPLLEGEGGEAWTRGAEQLAAQLIGSFLRRGNCEFMSDFAQKYPVLLSLRHFEIPPEDCDKLVEYVSAGVRPSSARSPEAAGFQFATYVNYLMSHRMTGSARDPISRLLEGKLGARSLNNNEAFGMTVSLLSGFEGISATMGWIARFLATSPSHRAELSKDPRLIPQAVHELLRRFSVSNLAREVRDDVVFHGIRMRRGQRVLLPTCLHNLDERIFKDPLEVDFHRKDASQHLAFSMGPHECPGRTIAEREIRIFIHEWLKRIPDFQIDSAKKVVMGGGSVHSLLKLPLRWRV